MCDKLFSPTKKKLVDDFWRVYLTQRFEFCLHYEIVFTEFTAACVRALDPLVQTGLVYETQRPNASARSDEWTVVVPFTVADPERRKIQ